MLRRGSEYLVRASGECQGDPTPDWGGPAQSARCGFGTSGGLCQTKAGPGSHGRIRSCEGQVWA